MGGKEAKHRHVSIQTPKLHISPVRISKINFFGGYKSTGHPVYSHAPHDQNDEYDIDVMPYMTGLIDISALDNCQYH